MDIRKLKAVARFELGDALRSRLVLFVLALYGAGAALGAYGFSRALAAAEEAARASLPGALGAHDIPDDVVRRRALPGVLSAFVRDPALLEELSALDPLAVFYGYMALSLVAVLVLLTSGGIHASARARGTTRFVLTRCDRLSWSLGKLWAHALLLALGLSTGAVVTLAVGLGQGQFDAASALWTLRAAVRAWFYGVAYLGMFSGIGLMVKTPGAARGLSILFWLLLALGHALADSEWISLVLPPVRYVIWLLPAQYKPLLWSSGWVEGSACLALLLIGALGFTLGHQVFRRGDA